MIVDDLDCETIQEGYLRRICEGTSGLTPEQEAKYRASWLAKRILPLPRKVGLGDIVAGAIKVATLGLVKPCGPCEKRRKKLNELGDKLLGS